MNIDFQQRFIFGLTGSPEPLGSFKLDNIYVPTISSPSQTNFEMRNNALSGYRWIHETTSTDTYGSFKLQKFLTGSTSGIDLMVFNDDGSFLIPGVSPNAKYILQQPDVSLANAQALSALTTGILKNTTTTGVLSIAVPGIDFFPMSGGTLTGDLILNGDPTNALGAVTRQYADAISQGLEFKNSCYAASTTNLAATYANGTSGVGATLTNSGTLAAFSIDGVNPPLNSRILVKNQSSGFQNGIYTVTTVGDGSTAWVLTRASDYNQVTEIKAGDFIVIDNGTANTRTGWVQTATVATIGTDPLTFSSFGTSGTVTSVTGTSGQISVINGTSTPVISIDPTYLGQASITTLGTVTSGTWNGSIVSPAFGGTGVNNASKTITLGGNFVTSGAFNTTFNITGATNVTFPTSGTLATQAYVDNNLNLPRLGIGVNPTVDGRIQFANTEMVNKISLFNTSGNDYNQNGFGYNALGTLYHAQLGTSHTFYLGNSTTIPLRVNVLGIHIAELRPIDADYRRIMFYDEGENLHQIYNIGIKTLDGTNHAIHSQVSNYLAAFTWAYGLTAVSSYELMRLNNDALKINNGKLTILESANFTSWDLKSISDGTFSLNKTDITNNTFSFSSSVSSSFFSVVNQNATPFTYFRIGTSTDYLQLGYDGPNDYSFINIQGSSNDRLAFRVNGTGVAALTQSGLFMLGGITPTLGKLQVNGGVQNTANEETAIHVRSALNNVKIELQCTSGTGRIWEIRSSNYGSFDVTDRTGSRTLYTIDANANHIFNTVGTLFAKRPRGYLSMSGNATAAASVANTWVKIAGTTVLSGTSNLFDMPVNNRLRYTGTPTLLNGSIRVSLTITYATSVATRLGFSIFKNGALLSDTPKYVTNNNTNYSMHVSLTAATSFATNDYIEIYFLSPNGGVNLVGTDLAITVE